MTYQNILGWGLVTLFILLLIIGQPEED